MSTGQLLEQFANQRVIISTMDSRVLIGIVHGYDSQCNIVLVKCKERIFSSSRGVDIMEHGMYIVRGDNVATIGEIDENIDGEIHWEEVVAEPLKPIRY